MGRIDHIAGPKVSSSISVHPNFHSLGICEECILQTPFLVWILERKLSYNMSAASLEPRTEPTKPKDPCTP